MSDRDPASLMRLITNEIWCNRRYELVDELISEDFVDHIEAQGLEGTGRARYLASARLVHEAFSDYHEEPVVRQDRWQRRPRSPPTMIWLSAAGTSPAPSPTR